MRGFSGDQISTLYNGIPIGPSTMTGRPMDAAGLQQVEIIKGPDSLVAGLGATGGAINYVNKAPHTGPIVNEAFTSYDSFNGYRAGYGSGGSTLINGLDYRFDISHFNNKGFIDDTYSKLSNVSGQLNYRVNENLKIWGATEYRQDNDRFYWGRRWCRRTRRASCRRMASSPASGATITSAAARRSRSPSTRAR